MRWTATWRSGYAAVCKTVYPSSILGVASSLPLLRSFGLASLQVFLRRLRRCSVSDGGHKDARRKAHGRLDAFKAGAALL